MRGLGAARRPHGGPVRRGRLARLGAAFAAAGIVLSFPAAMAQGSSTVLVARVADPITPVIADHLVEGVERAEREGMAAMIVEMDTPGGLDTSMREIIQSFLGAEVPIIVYVAPSGGRAASAGALIGLSAHVLAMAPGTTIGAATPVDLQGGDISKKIINDAAAYAETIARRRGRSTEFAIAAVREGEAITAEEAAAGNVADLLAPSRAALLDEVDGRTVTVSGGRDVRLDTKGAAEVAYDLRGFRRILQWLADPNLAFLFMSLGTLAIVYELAAPGFGPGIAGVIMIVLGLFALSVLPVNAVGALLLLLAVILFVAEVFTAGVGVFAAGGTAALLVGGLFLFRGSVGVDLAVLVPTVVVAGGGSGLAGALALRARRAPTITGQGQLIGRRATVQAATEDGRGSVMLAGAWWTAGRRDGEPLAAGDEVVVVEMEGLGLIVEPAGAEDRGSA